MTIAKTKEFKQTEIGEIPTDWGVKSVEDALDNDWNESKDSVPKSEYKATGTYPIIDQSKDPVAGHTDDENKVYRANLPLIIFGDHTRVLKYVDFPFVTGADGTQLLKAKRDFYDPRFLFYALKSLDIPNRGYNRHYKALKEKSLPHPPTPEQEKIAGVLSKLQMAVENQERIVANLYEVKAATTARLFREGLQGEPLKNTDIGEMPRSWQAATLSTVCADTGTLNPGKDPDKIIEYIDVSSVSREECRIISSTRYKGKDAPGRARNLVKHRDVIFATVRPTLRRVALIPKDFDGQLVSTAFCVIRAIEPKAYPEYLYYVVSSPTFIAQVGRLERGANYPAVTNTNVLSQKIPLPGYDEQKEIASELMKIDKALSSNTEKAKHLSDLFTVTLNQLMTGKVRV